MLIGARIAMFVLGGLLCVAPAQAAKLFPLQTRQWMEMDKQDQAGHKWTVRGDVLEEVTLNNKKYFHVQQQNYDPVEGDTFDNNYIRSTDTELFIYIGDGELLAFRTGLVGDSWEHQEFHDDGTPFTVHKEIVSTNDLINIPYGGTYSAYKYKQYPSDDPSKYHFEWVVPGLGWIAKEEDYWVSGGRATPINSVLARMDKNPAPWTGNYSFVDIDYPQQTTTLNDIRGLNDLGQIVGSYTSGGRQYAFFKNGDTYSTLSGIPGTNSVAWGINDNGQVALQVMLNSANHGYIYDTANSSLTSIAVPGSYSTAVWGINGAGQVSGYYNDGNNRGFMYDRNTDSWTLISKANAQTWVYGVNNAGTTAGNYTLGGHDSGFTYDGSLHDLNVPGAQNTRALGINDHGDIAGRYWNDGGAIQGFIYSDGAFKTLTMPGDKKIVRLLGINNARQIVGLYTADGGASYHGFLGTPVPPRGLPALQLLLQDYSQ